MGYYITSITPENNDYFLLFVQGDEKGLNYIYKHLYKPALRHGRDIIQDDFVINSIAQEAFLRAWNFRERMTSMLHVFRFIRLCVRWGCYAYLKLQVSKFNRSFANLEFLENTRFAAYDPQLETEQQDFSLMEQERLQLIHDAIPYLPGNRQTIMTLYFKYGFNYKQIARRFGLPYQHISLEVQEGIDALKSIIVRSKMQAITPSQVQVAVSMPNYEKHLDAEQTQIFKLRYEKKYGFDKIARELNLPQFLVVKQYVIAHQTLKRLNCYGNKKNSRHP